MAQAPEEPPQGEQAVVIDNGSDTIKAGFSGEKNPQKIFTSLIGWYRMTYPLPNFNKEFYAGHEMNQVTTPPPPHTHTHTHTHTHSKKTTT